MNRSKVISMVVLAACGSIPTNSSDAGSDAGNPVQVERGPKVIAIDGDANGLWWDAASNTLFIADDDNNRILKWTDSGGFSEVAVLPAAPANGPGLGQVVRTNDGTLVVTRFGYGTAGDVVFVRPDGGTGTVPNLDVLRRRIGLAIAPDGTLYDSYFVKTTTQFGGVSKLDLVSGETEVVTSLHKPVGVLVVGDVMYISDQNTGEILKAPLATPATTSQLASTGFTPSASPDLLSAGPAGTLFTGGGTGSAFKVSIASGTVSPVGTGFQQVRGTAYDAVNKRLFVADHDGDTSNGTTNFIQIIPIDP